MPQKAPRPWPTRRSQSPQALVDFDGNGRLDVVVAEDLTPPRWRVYRNHLCP
jgi:hypothetical protein